MAPLWLKRQVPSQRSQPPLQRPEDSSILNVYATGPELPRCLGKRPEAYNKKGTIRSLQEKIFSYAWVSVEVDQAGSATEARLVGGDYSDLCAKSLQELMTGASYIPAHQNGVPVGGRYLGPFH